MSRPRGDESPSMTLLLGSLLLLPIAIVIAAPNALAASSISAQVFPSSTTASAGDTISVAVVVLNTGASSAQITSVNLIVPPGWTKPLTGQGPSVLLPNQEGVWTFNVHVSSSTISSSALQYNVVAVVNSSIGAAVGSASIQANPANVALPGGNIPVSLILIVIPGVLSIAIFGWFSGTKPSVDWRYAVLSFLVGSLGWYFAPWPFGDPLRRNIFTLDLQSGPYDYASVAVWAIGVGVVAATVFVAINNLAPKIELRLEDQLRILREPQTKTTDTLDYALTRANMKSMKRSPRAMPYVEVKAGSPAITKKGLLKSFDDKPPYDLLLVPRYEVDIDETELESATKKIMKWHGGIPLNWWLRWKVRRKLGRGLEQAKAEDLAKLHPSEQIEVVARIGDHIRKKQFKDPGVSHGPTLTTMDENEIETLIKGGEVHMILVDKYVSPYVLEVAAGGKTITLPAEG